MGSLPDTAVLSIDTEVYPRKSYESDGDARSSYFNYFSGLETMFQVS